MTNNSIEMEIVRLVREIAKDEIKIVGLRDAAINTTTERFKERYTEQANRYEESLNRKFKLLSILKGDEIEGV